MRNRDYSIWLLLAAAWAGCEGGADPLADAGAPIDAADAAADGATPLDAGCQGPACPARDLGAVALIGSSLGRSHEIEFTLEAPLRSFVISALDDDALETERIGIVKLTDPLGTVLIDSDDGIPDLNPASRPYVGVATALVPSTDAARALPMPGTYRVVIAAFEADGTTPAMADRLVERMLVHTTGAAPVGGVIDLHLRFAPASGVQPETTDGQAFANEMGSVVGEFLAAMGPVAVGAVESAALPAEYDVIEDGPQLRGLVRTESSAPAGSLAVNVFVVGDLAFAAGFTGAAPSPPGVYGTTASGIVIERLADARATGVLLAHELGHYLGLRHTTDLTYDAMTERYRAVEGDPISDTPECSEVADPALCRDAVNLMFPSFRLFGSTISPGQAKVALGHPAIHPAEPAASQ